MFCTAVCLAEVRGDTGFLSALNFRIKGPQALVVETTKTMPIYHRLTSVQK
jgi:hypothetical protein